MKSISNLFAFNRLNEFQKAQYRAGFIGLDGVLTAVGRVHLEEILQDKYKEELAEAAIKLLAEQPTS